MSLPLGVHRRLPRRLPRSLGFKKYTLSFDGVDDYVESSVLKIFDGDFTIELLFKSGDKREGFMLVGNYPNGYVMPFVSFYTEPDGKISFYHRDVDGRGCRPITESVVLDNKWHHIVGVRDRTNAKSSVYVDGKLDTQEDDATTDCNNDYPITLMLHNNDRFLRGYIAFVRIYSRGLSQAEIRWNMLEYHNPVRDGLVLWLHDRIVGDTWYDESPYNNDGTIYGAVKKGLAMWEIRAELGL